MPKHTNIFLNRKQLEQREHVDDDLVTLIMVHLWPSLGPVALGLPYHTIGIDSTLPISTLAMDLPSTDKSKLIVCCFILFRAAFQLSKGSKTTWRGSLKSQKKRSKKYQF